MGKRTGRRKKENKKKYPETVRFHFLENQEVIDKIGKRFRIMFIMRGLPGSGKSTMTEKIVALYPNTVVCSSDHFLTENTIYDWTPEKRNFGHKYCWELASRCCEMKCPIIVVDNTNIEKREVKVYTDLASENGYITILVTPNTPWNFDPFQLEKHCSHSVPLHTLRYKLTVYDEIPPVYHAWFLDPEDAKHVFEMALDTFLQSLKEIPEFSLHLSAMSDTETDYDPKHHYDSTELSLSYCIAKWCRSGDTDFHKRKSVKESIGKIFQLCVSQILISPCVVAALVDLSADQLEIYEESEVGSPCENEEDEEQEEQEQKQDEESTFQTVVGRKSHQCRKGKKSCPENDLSEKTMEILKEAVEEKLRCVLSQITPGVGFYCPGKQNTKEAEFESNAEKKCTGVNNLYVEDDRDISSHGGYSGQQMSETDERLLTENSESGRNLDALKLSSDATEIPTIGRNSSERHRSEETKNVGEVAETRREDKDVRKNTDECDKSQRDDGARCQSTKSNEDARRGQCAHILLGSRDKGDFAEISKEIRRISELKEGKEGNLKSFWKFSNDDAQVFYFGEGTCLMNLKRNIYLNTIYACQY